MIAILAGVATIISAIVCHLLEIQVVIDPDQLIMSLPVSGTFITPGHKIVKSHQTLLEHCSLTRGSRQ